jgi:hypothetical protein
MSSNTDLMSFNDTKTKTKITAYGIKDIPDYGILGTILSRKYLKTMFDRHKQT